MRAASGSLPAPPNLCLWSPDKVMSRKYPYIAPAQGRSYSEERTTVRIVTAVNDTLKIRFNQL